MYIYIIYRYYLYLSISLSMGWRGLLVEVQVRDNRVGSSCHHADPRFFYGMLGWRPLLVEVLVRDARVESSFHHADPRFWCGILGWGAHVTMRTPGFGAGCWGGELY